MTYKPNYYPLDIKGLSEMANISGRSPRDCVAIEEASQKVVAESEKWLIATKVNWNGKNYNHDGITASGKLIEFGFTEIQQADNLFYSCIPPKGWTKETTGYWTTIKDETGKERMSQFYKGAFYDRDAFINILK